MNSTETNVTAPNSQAACARGEQHVETVLVQQLPDGRLTAKEAARYLGISEKTLANYRWRGMGPEFIRLCGRIFYRLEALAAYVLQAPRGVSAAQASQMTQWSAS